MRAKPKDLKYTDLCIYIDKVNYYRDKDNNPIGLRELSEEEIENVYTYLYHIIYALAVKKRMLTKKSDYDIFCIESAGDIYMRLRKPNQDYTGEQKANKAIKSVLNYIKGALGFMCIRWRENNYCQVLSYDQPKNTDQEKGLLKYESVKNFVKTQATNQFTGRRQEELDNLITKIPGYFKETAEKSIFKKDNLSCYQLLLSLYLTLLNSLILTKKQLKVYDKNKINSKILQQLTEKNKFIINFSTNPIITKDFIDITLKKAFNKIGEEYEEVIHFVEPSESDIDNILDSAYKTYDTDQSRH